MNDGDWVEWGYGGLATVKGEPFKQYGRMVARILPANTGDVSTGTGHYTRLWPVAQLKPADMSRWVYYNRSNSFRRMV